MSRTLHTPRSPRTAAAARAILLLASLVFFTTLAAPAAARQDAAQKITAVAVTDVTQVYVGESFQLRIAVEGTLNVEPPALPPVEGLVIVPTGSGPVSYSSHSIVGGRTQSTEYQAFVFHYAVTPSRPGDHVIPPVSVRAAGRQFTTQEVRFRALPGETDGDVKVRLESSSLSPYVGEPITLKVTLGLRRSATRAEFFFPGVEEKFSLVDAPPNPNVALSDSVFELLGAKVPAYSGATQFDGQDYQSFTAERIVIPREPGPITLGPVTVTCDVIIQRAASIFDRDRVRRVSVSSDPVQLDVRPLPAEGRPDHFNGLVGAYRIDASASPTEVNVGDPITLEMRIEGPLPGSVPAPAIERQPQLADAFRIAASDAPGVLDGRAIVFRRTLRALRAGVSAIPPIELPYFDTRSGAYKIARTDPIPLSVRETRVVTAADAEGAADTQPTALEVRDNSIGLRANYEGPALLADQSFDLAARLARPGNIAAVALPPAVFGVAALALVARRRAGSSSATMRRRAAALANTALDSVTTSDAGAAASQVGAALRRYIAHKAGLDAAHLASREAADAARASAPAAADPVAELLRRCDDAAYGGLNSVQAQKLVEDARAVIDRLEASWNARP
ncbi:MAG: BatD family protein [Planctomycetota bacterium]|nr:BatD family protein [Planctomycetota bacterium]